MNNSSNWTGRVPRNTQSAFGPYTSDELEPMKDDSDYLASDCALLFILTLVLAYLVLEAINWVEL